EASSEELELLHLCLDTTCKPQPRLVLDRDLTEVTVHIQPNETHVASSSMVVGGRPGRQNDSDGFVLTAQPGESQGRTQSRSGSQPIPQVRPAHPAFSREPLSRCLDANPHVKRPAEASTQFSSPE